MAAEKKKPQLRLIKWLLWGLLAVLLCLIENTWYATGSDAVLRLLPVLCAAAGFYEGRRGGAYFGIFCGLLSDAAGGASIWISPVIFMLIGYLAALCGRKLRKKAFPAFLLLDLTVSAAFCVWRFFVSLFMSRFSYTVFLFGILPLGKDLLVSFLFGLLLYIPVLLISVIGRDNTRYVSNSRARIVSGTKR